MQDLAIEDFDFDDMEDMTDSDEDEGVMAPESSANVSSTIMLKIPTFNLAFLREDFESKPDGLELNEFLQAFVRNMDLVDDEDLLRIVPDLIDFFNLVDINGDGSMQWSEFVMFVIEQVVEDEKSVIFEKVDFLAKHQIQPPASRNTVKCSKYLSDLGKLVVGIGAEVQVYDTDEQSPTWFGPCLKLKLRDKDSMRHQRPGKKEAREKADQKPTENICAIDFAYVGSADVLVILRSDLCFEFYKFLTRAKISIEVVVHFGIQQLHQTYARIAVQDVKGLPPRLFCATASEIVDSWELVIKKISPVTLGEPKQLQRHTDFVRDILVIQNDTYGYRFFVSGGLDRAVHLFDLETLEYRTTRTGLTSGVECLAYDNRTTLLAGGYDHRIVAWDLEAQLNRPLFQLWGHTDIITHILAFDFCDRCVSLDVRGELKLWDISRFSTEDKQAREITSFFCSEDRARCAAVVPRPSSKYPSLHGLVLIAQGRNQHIFKITDTSAKESPPVAALHSLNLMMLITVHSHDVILWNLISGDEVSRISGLGGGNGGIYGDLVVATMDDCCKKLILGDSTGNILQYNCLNRTRMKTFPPLAAAPRFLIYSPDKVLIALTVTGRMYIFDDCAEDDHNPLLRKVQAHDTELTAAAYSHRMGLIATADSKGTLKLWDYEFLSIELIVSNFMTGEICQLHFLEPLPLLLVADNAHNFVVLPVAAAAKTHGKKYWKLKSFVKRPESAKSELRRSFENRRSFDNQLNNNSRTTPRSRGAALQSPDQPPASPQLTPSRSRQRTPMTAESARKSFLTPQKNKSLDGLTAAGSASVVVAAAATDSPRSIKPSNANPRGVTLDTIGLLDDALSSMKLNSVAAQSASRRGTPVAARKLSLMVPPTPSSVASTPRSEIAPDTPSKVFTLQRLQRFLRMKRDVKCMAVYHGPMSTANAEMTSAAEKEGRLNTLSLATEPSILLNASEIALQPAPVDGSSSVIGQETPYTPTIEDDFMSRTEVVVVCGHEDGTIAEFDLTQALLRIGCAALRQGDDVFRSQNYDPRRKIVSTRGPPSTLEIQRVSYSTDDLDNNASALKCELKAAWLAHGGLINSLQLIGDNNDVFTCGDDHVVLTHSRTGVQEGILSRGRETDKLIKPNWKNPIDMKRRRQLRRIQALQLVAELGLERVTNKDQFMYDSFEGDIMRPVTPYGESKDNFARISNATRPTSIDAHVNILTATLDNAGSNHQQKRLQRTSTTNSILEADNDVKSNASTSDMRRVESTGNLSQGSVDSTTRRSRSKRYQDEYDPEDKFRVIGQLDGAMTYEPSTKQLTQIKLLERTKALHDRLNHLATGKKKRRRRRKVEYIEMTADENTRVVPSGNYLNELMQIGETETKLAKDRERQRKQELGPKTYEHKPRKLKTKFDSEIEWIDIRDKSNWELGSVNRQRAMYQKYYVENDKYRGGGSFEKVLIAKLDALSPNGDFQQFAQLIRKERNQAKYAFQGSGCSYKHGATTITDSQVHSYELPTASYLSLIGREDGFMHKNTITSDTLLMQHTEETLHNSKTTSTTDILANTKTYIEAAAPPMDIVLDSAASKVSATDIEDLSAQLNVEVLDFSKLLPPITTTSEPTEAPKPKKHDAKALSRLCQTNPTRQFNTERLLSRSLPANQQLDSTISNNNNDKKKDNRNLSTTTKKTTLKSASTQELLRPKQQKPQPQNFKSTVDLLNTTAIDTNYASTLKPSSFTRPKSPSPPMLPVNVNGIIKKAPALRPIDQNSKILTHQFQNVDDAATAIAERSKTYLLMKSFDRELRLIDKNYKKAYRDYRKSKKKSNLNMNPQLFGMEANSNRVFLEQIPIASLSNMSANSELFRDAVPKLQGPFQNSAKTLLQEQTSLRGLLRVGDMRLNAEKSIHRKIRFTLRAYGAKVHDKHSSVLNFLKEVTSLQRLAGDYGSVGATSYDSIEQTASSRTSTVATVPAVHGNVKQSADSYDSKFTSYESSYDENDERLVDRDTLRGDAAMIDALILEDPTQISLMNMINTRKVQSNAQYAVALVKLLEHKSMHGKIARDGITASLSEIVHHLAPYMTHTERMNSYRYLQEHIELELQERNVDRVTVTAEQLRTLRALFGFFDKDKSGQVDVGEIMMVLKGTLHNRQREAAETFSLGLETRDVDQDMVVRMIELVDEDKNHQLDFNEFVRLFKDTVVDMVIEPDIV